MLRMKCVRGPFDGEVREISGDASSYMLTGDGGVRAIYTVVPSSNGPVLVFDQDSVPAWATEQFPVLIEYAGRQFRVWPSKAFGERRWCVNVGAGCERLTDSEVDIDATVQHLQEWVEQWWEARQQR